MDFGQSCGGHHAGGPLPYATGADDRLSHFSRAASYHVEPWHGGRCDERIAAPMVGGMITTTILILLVIPVIYNLWQGMGATPGE